MKSVFVWQGDRLPLNKQLQNHQTTISRLETLLPNKTSVKEHLNKCLYIVGIGNNDYLNNYFTPEFFPTSKLYTPHQYAQVLIQQYSQQLNVCTTLILLNYLKFWPRFFFVTFFSSKLK